MSFTSEIDRKATRDLEPGDVIRCPSPISGRYEVVAVRDVVERGQWWWIYFYPFPDCTIPGGLISCSKGKRWGVVL